MAKSRSARKHPPTVPAKPVRRDLTFDLPVERITDWHTPAGPHFTAFLNTFSLVLPVGERFFIDSVRHYRDQITDPQLKQEVTAFIGQEAMHGREHQLYNEALFKQVGVAARFEKLVGEVLAFMRKNAPPSMCLSSTIALEHFTALLADRVLQDPELSAGAEPRFAALWRWHALEETEHKGVAYDVWESVMGTGPRAYIERTGGMLLTTAIFWTLIIPAHLLVLREEGVLSDMKSWRKFFRYSFGRVGMLRKLVLPWADYFRPGFHPWDHDNSRFLAEIESFSKAYRASSRSSVPAAA